MPLVTTKELVEDGVAGRKGVGAFNVVTLEHAEAIVTGAEQAGAPVILQLSENAVRFHNGRARPVIAAMREIATTAAVPVSLHLDHVESQDLLREAANLAVSSVMFDASHLGYPVNVAATRAAVNWAHRHDIYLEAELGEVGGKGGAHASGARTQPAEAARYVLDTGVDALAVAVGSSHAMTSRTARIDHALVARLHAAVPVPLVLHGSSGVPDEDLRAAIAAGMTKINIGTILNIAYTDAVGAGLRDSAFVDPRSYLADARAEMSDVVQRLLLLLNNNPART
jgi:fructose-bisphosphate aldolase class II